jgi:glycosyltransferase involved in cell wall biosynthesis
MHRTLYICYFGLREPLVQTQVLPYLRELVRAGADDGQAPIGAATLLTFEPKLSESWTKERLDAMRAELAAQGIDWRVLPYHKRFSVLATSWDILRGTILVRELIATQEVDVLHGRVHVPTLMGALARKLSSRKPKLVFDIRGFFPEEYTDAGRWRPNGLVYRSVKRIEGWLMNEADAFVVLTVKAREALFPDAASADPDAERGGGAPGWWDRVRRPVEVIPCCVDFESRFADPVASSRDEVRERLNATDRFVITHLGALGGLYLTQQLVDFVAAARARNPKVFALFLTQTDVREVEPLLKARGFGPGDYFVGKVPPRDVQQYLGAADLALSLVKASYATLSRSPTKIPEYLACGLPIVANRGVGDVDDLLEGERVGSVLRDLSDGSYHRAMDEVSALGDISQHCRAVARARFDLRTVGGVRYRRLYRRLLGDG